LTALLLTAMVLELLVLLALLAHARGHVRQSFPRTNPGEPSPAVGAWPLYPRVALLVPLTGDSPAMEAALTSLLTQPYPNYETVLVTRDLDDPATALVRRLLARHPRVRHIVSGPASGCSQKNRNILAGLGSLNDAVEILVFCDSTHVAPPYFLQELVHPLATGAAALTTGFHRIAPGDSRVATLGMVQTVMTIHLLHSLPEVVLPWGGATAVRRSVFRDAGLDRVWGASALDDIPLGLRLKHAGVRVVPVAPAMLDTPLAGETLKGWSAWLTRQIIYPKFFMPCSWLAGALAVAFLVGPVLAAALALLGGCAGLVPPPLALASLGFLLALTGIGVWSRTLIPHPVPLGPWLLALYATIFMAGWCYLRTWFTNTIAWRGISYRVAWGGWVQRIILKPAPRERTP
jgi:ceramide glucosyltransferase